MQSTSIIAFDAFMSPYASHPGIALYAVAASEDWHMNKYSDL